MAKNGRRRRVADIEAEYGKRIDQVLWELYYARQLTQKEIATELALDRTSIIRLMRRHGIPTRRPTWVYVQDGSQNRSVFPKWRSDNGEREA